MRIIDSHVHFWRIGGPCQTWPGADLPTLYRDFGLVELREAIASSGADIQSVVLVQSQPDDRDTDWLLDLAADLSLVAAVVGWVDLASPLAPARIAGLAGKSKLRSIRPMLQSIEDTYWLLRPELEPALHAMAQQGLCFDALIQPRHLPMLMEFARRWPKLPIVIDHGAKPRIPLGEIEPWQAQLTELSLFPNVCCKLSGLRTEQAAGAPSAELAPYMGFLMSAFQDRLMWGSDWPVLLQSGDRYGDWLQTSIQAAQLQGISLQSLLSGAAGRFYGLD